MTAEADEPIDLEAFDAEIVRIADGRLSQGEPQLINALGIQLGPKLAAVKRQTGLTFTQYLKSRFSDRFDIIEIKRNTPGLWPKGKPPEAAVESFSQHPARPPSRRYLRWFWNAFAEPLPSGRRFFDPSERRIRDVETPADPSWIEIPADLIRREDEPRNFRDTHLSIDEWLREAGQSPESFLEPPATRPPHIPGRSVLDAVIEALNPRQLQSVTMPLDVVAELGKRRV